MFDPHKLDISDEFKQVISTLKGHDDKVGNPTALLPSIPITLVTDLSRKRWL